MPAKTVKGNSVLDSLDNADVNKALKGSLKDEVKTGFTKLPPGIEGIARLDIIKFDRYKSGNNEGKAYYQARAVILEPETAKDPKTGITRKIRGRQTMVMIPLCKTKTQTGKVTELKEYVKRVTHELRKLGADVSGVETISDLGPIAEQLVEEKPCFNFSTAAQKNGDGIWENWNGTKGLEDYVPEELEEEDNTGDSEEADESSEEEVNEDESEESGDETEDDGLDELAEKAKDDDADAQNELEEKAKEAGLTAKEIKAVKTWKILVEKIREKLAESGDGEDASDEEESSEEESSEEEAGEEESSEEEVEEVVPSKTDVFHYKPKGVKKNLECEVVAVNKPKKLCDLKDLATKKVYKGVKFADLIVIES